MVLLCRKIVLMLSVTLIILGVLLLVEPSSAPITTPSWPKSGPEIVSVEMHHNPIWNPPTNWTDPYTGQVLSSTLGYYIQNGSIEITIKNRPFKPYTDENGNYINVYYCYFRKGIGDGWLGANSAHMGSSNNMLPCAVYQSDSSYTTITSSYYSDNHAGRPIGDISFKFQAVEEGYFMIHDENFAKWVYEGVGSTWIEFTITIPYSDTTGISKLNIKTTSNTPTTSNPSNTPSPPNTDTPTTSNPYNPPPQNPWISNLPIIIATICIIIIPLLIVTYLNKQLGGCKFEGEKEDNPRVVVTYLNKQQQRKVQSVNAGFVKNVYVGI